MFVESKGFRAQITKQFRKKQECSYASLVSAEIGIMVVIIIGVGVVIPVSSALEKIKLARGECGQRHRERRFNRKEPGVFSLHRSLLMNHENIGRPKGKQVLSRTSGVCKE